MFFARISQPVIPSALVRTVRRPVELVDRSDIPKAPKRHGGGDEVRSVVVWLRCWKGGGTLSSLNYCTQSLLDKTRLATAANYARFLIPKSASHTSSVII